MKRLQWIVLAGISVALTGPAEAACYSQNCIYREIIGASPTPGGITSRPNPQGGYDYSNGITSRANPLGGYDFSNGVTCRRNPFGGLDCR